MSGDEQSIRTRPDDDLPGGAATRKLRNVLRVNAGFSLLTGSVSMIAGGAVADLLGIDHQWLVRASGAGLLLFAGAVVAVAGAKTTALAKWCLFVSVADLGWVAGTIAIVVAGWLSTGGAIVMGLIAIVVFEFALTQLYRRNRMLAVLADASPPRLSRRSGGQRTVEVEAIVVGEHEHRAQPGRVGGV